MPVGHHRKRTAAMAVELAREDPELVKQVIARLRESGEIAHDDLVYLDRIADRWIAIARCNRQATRPWQAFAANRSMAST